MTYAISINYPLVILLFVLQCYCPDTLQAETINMEVQAYINQYKGIAMAEAKRTQIPASIILAQAIVESQYGNSFLATTTYNHFGTKCKTNWYGDVYIYHDDTPDDCFRVYAHPIESFIDHSYFISQGPQYQHLLKQYTVTDYTSWAHGLAQAHYASDSNYATTLLNVIANYQLYTYDQTEKEHYVLPFIYFQYLRQYEIIHSYQLADVIKQQQSAECKQWLVNLNIHNYNPIISENIAKYIKAKYYLRYKVKKGDTLYRIAKQYACTVQHLKAWNPFIQQMGLQVGQSLKIVVY